jgi:hypothetical protein
VFHWTDGSISFMLARELGPCFYLTHMCMCTQHPNCNNRFKNALLLGKQDRIKLLITSMQIVCSSGSLEEINFGLHFCSSGGMAVKPC